MTENVNEQVDPELQAELEQLREIASSEGLTIAEYLQREVKKLLTE